MLDTILANIEVIISGLAFIVSIFSLWHSQRASIASIRPVLVFIYDEKIGWSIKNIGNGPALNIIIAQKHIKGDWFNPVRIPPLSTNSEFILSWLGHVNDTGLGAEYNDFENREYSAICGNDLSKVYNKQMLPKWSEKEIGRHWHHLS